MPPVSHPVDTEEMLDTWGRRNNRKIPDKQCAVYGKTFRPKKRSAKFCSKPCMYKGRKPPSATLPGEQNPNYKGGWVDQKGYKTVRVDGKRKRLHRQIMEIYLGRELHPYEVVHHKNGNKLDNRISNLEVIGFGTHSTHHNTNRKYKRNYKLNLTPTERQRRSQRMKEWHAKARGEQKWGDCT